ncbi:MAG: TolC family protein [Candidatus Margulisiibacteriota bacterium]|jgi:outer membrane protein TolC
MRRTLILFIALLLLLSSAAVFAAGEAQVYTWQEIASEAARQQPNLLSAQEKVKQAGYSENILRSGQLPQVSLGGSLDDGANYSLGVSARQLLFDGFKTSLDIQKAENDTIASGYNAALASAQVRLRLRKAFIDLLKNQELLKMSEIIAGRREQNLKLVELLYEAGKEHYGAYLTAKAKLFQAQSDLKQLKRTLQYSQKALSLELNKKDNMSLVVTGDLQVIVNYSPDLEFLASEHPSIKNLELQQESAALSLRAAQSDNWPSLTAGASGQFGGSHDRNSATNWSASLSLSLTLWDAGKRSGNVDKAISVIEQLGYDAESSRRQLALDLASAWNNLQNSLDQIEVQKQYLQASEVRAKIADSQYTNGLVSFDDWTIIEDGLIDSQKALLNSQSSALLAEANFIQVQGGALEK